MHNNLNNLDDLKNMSIHDFWDEDDGMSKEYLQMVEKLPLPTVAEIMENKEFIVAQLKKKVERLKKQQDDMIRKREKEKRNIELAKKLLKDIDSGKLEREIMDELKKSLFPGKKVTEVTDEELDGAFMNRLKRQ